MPFVGSGRGWGMKSVELYARVRFAVQIEGVSRREAARTDRNAAPAPVERGREGGDCRGKPEAGSGDE